MSKVSLERIKRELVRLYRKMYDLTRPECGQCRVPYSCCSREYCELAKGHAKKMWGVDLPEFGTFPHVGKVPYLVNNQCIVEPHLRPVCTLHTCDINSIGCKRGDTTGTWTIEYFRIRDRIELREYRYHELNRTGTKRTT